MTTYNEAKNPAETLDRVWELAKSMRTCMLTSWDGERQNSRPMSSHVMREAHAIYFLDKADSAKERQIEAYPAIGLSYMDSVGNKFLTFSGTGAVSNDRATIRQLWSPIYKTWWESAEDPSIRLITFSPHTAELWEGPNMLVAASLMLISAMTGAKPSLGENAKIAV